LEFSGRLKEVWRARRGQGKRVGVKGKRKVEWRKGKGLERSEEETEHRVENRIERGSRGGF